MGTLIDDDGGFQPVRCRHLQRVGLKHGSREEVLVLFVKQNRHQSGGIDNHRGRPSSSYSQLWSEVIFGSAMYLRISAVILRSFRRRSSDRARPSSRSSLFPKRLNDGGVRVLSCQAGEVVSEPLNFVVFHETRIHSSLLPGDPFLAAGFSKVPHAADIAGAFGDADDAAGIEQVEEVAGLDALVVGRQGEVAAQEGGAFGLGLGEVAGEQGGVGVFEVEGAVFAFGAEEDVAVGRRRRR